MLKKFLFTFLILLISQLNLSGDDNLSDKRIQEIQANLDAGKTHAQLWWYGWTGFYTGSALFSFTLAAFSNDRPQKILQNVQAVESLAGVGGLLIFPFPARYASQKLKAMPESSDEEKNAKLEKSEELLENSSKAEIAGRSLLQHTLAFLVNASGSAIIYFGYGKKIKDSGDNPLTQALINLGIGTAVAELQIWTQPTRAIDDWKKYRDKYHPPAKSDNDIRINLFSVPQKGGIVAGLQFRF
jgi:hypothetical protein